MSKSENFTTQKSDEKSITTTKSLQDYVKSFDKTKDSYPKDSKLAKAYEVALDIRKFEIDLYWKRSNSFWVLVGGIAAALGVMLSGKADISSNGFITTNVRDVICCCLSLAGATISYAWSLVNAGSKFWQRNWEYQVDALENEVIGPLYKTVLTNSTKRSMYSVSEINIWISRYIFIIFSICALIFFAGRSGENFLLHIVREVTNQSYTPKILMGAIILLNIIAVIIMHRRVISKVTEEAEHNFDVSIHASIRNIDLKKLHGSPRAQDLWQPTRKIRKRVKLPTR
jgi:hypothetical protein